MWPRSTSTLRHKQTHWLLLDLKLVLDAPAHRPSHLLCPPPHHLDFQGKLKPSGPALHREAELPLPCPTMRTRGKHAWSLCSGTLAPSGKFLERQAPLLTRWVPKPRPSSVRFQCCQSLVQPTRALRADTSPSLSMSLLLPPFTNTALALLQSKLCP